MYVCIYIHVCIHVCICIYTHIYIYIYDIHVYNPALESPPSLLGLLHPIDGCQVEVLVYIYIEREREMCRCIYVYLCVYIYIYIYTDNIYIYICIYIYTHTQCINICMCVYIYIYIHIIIIQYVSMIFARDAADGEVRLEVPRESNKRKRGVDKKGVVIVFCERGTISSHTYNSQASN